MNVFTAVPHEVSFLSDVEFHEASKEEIRHRAEIRIVELKRELRERKGVLPWLRNRDDSGGSGPFYYCNSGGDSALLLPSELAEDETARGVSDLRAVIERAGAEDAPVMVIGVTCGMSAPYVAAQLDFVLGQICGAISQH